MAAALGHQQHNSKTLLKKIVHSAGLDNATAHGVSVIVYCTVQQQQYEQYQLLRLTRWTHHA